MFKSMINLDQSGKKNLFIFFVFSLFIIHYSLFTIEVGGHLTENTTWSPENNPYLVVDDVYVDSNVILTILPGTVVKLNASPLTSYGDMDSFVYYNGENIAKMIQVDGQLIANGTEDNPIVFTRIQDSLYYHWGIIYLREDAGLCSFKYCTLEYSAYLLIVLGIIPSGAICIHNEDTIIENCNFIDNLTGVYVNFFPQNIVIKNSNFYNIDNISPTYPGTHERRGLSIGTAFSNEANILLIAGNSFTETGSGFRHVKIDNSIPSHIVNNYFLGYNGLKASMESEKESYIFDNDFINFDQYGIRGGEEENSLYINNNRFIEGVDGIDINYGYVEIMDNYFEDSKLELYNAESKIVNNIFINDSGPDSNPAIFGIPKVFNNNLVYGCVYAFSGIPEDNFSNNIFVANDFAF
ncbi:MAG: right-handed parallel beta-helix repeat-containing protein, partial [Candidatus Cloacimonetes bacterium]|nr:right-handed parallel beta-helix repeat-containing protein [Candidatus Cloacimonadota bacterium]